MYQFFLFAALCVATVVHADVINRCRDSSGHVIFTDRPCSDLAASTVGSHDYSDAGSRADGLTASQRRRVERLDKRLDAQRFSVSQPQPSSQSDADRKRTICKNIEREIKAVDARARAGYYYGSDLSDRRRKLRDQWFDLRCQLP